MYWISLALIWIGAAAYSNVTDKPKKTLFMGYHRTIGIYRMKEIERQMMENAENNKNSRLAGGWHTIHERYPWMVGLLLNNDTNVPWRKNRSMCGGTLLDETRVLTAGHCIYERDFYITSIAVTFGSDHLLWGGSVKEALHTLTHRSWQGDWSDKWQVNIGILWFPSIVYKPTLQPVVLPTADIFKDERFAGWTANAVGYGGFLHKNIEVELEILPHEQCSPTTNPPYYMCTGGRLGDGIVGTCRYDSGGPLTVSICAKNILVGIILRSELDCESGAPSYHTRVTDVLYFITGNVEIP